MSRSLSSLDLLNINLNDPIRLTARNTEFYESLGQMHVEIDRQDSLPCLTLTTFLPALGKIQCPVISGLMCFPALPPG